MTRIQKKEEYTGKEIEEISKKFEELNINNEKETEK